MNDGLKRTLRYCNIEQIKAMLYICCFAVIYGLVMVFFINDENGINAGTLKPMLAYTQFLLSIFIISYQSNFLRMQANTMLSFGALRKDVALGQQLVLFAHIIEAGIVILACAKLICNITYGTQEIMIMFESLFFAATIGMYIGLVARRWGRKGTVIVMGIVVAASVSAFMIIDEGIPIFATGAKQITMVGILLGFVITVCLWAVATLLYKRELIGYEVKV